MFDLETTILLSATRLKNKKKPAKGATFDEPNSEQLKGEIRHDTNYINRQHYQGNFFRFPNPLKPIYWRIGIMSTLTKQEIRNDLNEKIVKHLTDTGLSTEHAEKFELEYSAEYYYETCIPVGGNCPLSSFWHREAREIFSEYQDIILEDLLEAGFSLATLAEEGNFMTKCCVIWVELLGSEIQSLIESELEEYELSSAEFDKLED